MAFIAYLIFGIFMLAIPSNTQATLISFDNIRSGNYYTEDGYQFIGSINPDNNFPESPALRIYGNWRLEISRLDGKPFTIESFDLLYKPYPDTHWLLSSDVGRGLNLERDHFTYNEQNIGLTTLTSNSTYFWIYNYNWSGTDYIVFDNFNFIDPPAEVIVSSPVPEPTSFLLIAIGLAIGVPLSRRFKQA